MSSNHSPPTAPRRLALLQALKDPDRIIASHAALTYFGLMSFYPDFSINLPTQPSTMVLGPPFQAQFARRPRARPAKQPRASNALAGCPRQRAFSIWDGTLIQLTAIFPLLWLTKPRRRPRSLRRWSLNTVSLLSLAALCSIILIRIVPHDQKYTCQVCVYTTRQGKPAETLIRIGWNIDTLSFLSDQGPVLGGEFATSHDIKLLGHYAPNRSGKALSWEDNPLKSYRCVQARYQVVAIAFALLPLLWLTLAIKNKPHPKGHCPHCGYDLRASPNHAPNAAHHDLASNPKCRGWTPVSTLR